jgi:uncharacterized protein involved in copper resistance
MDDECPILVELSPDFIHNSNSLHISQSNLDTSKDINHSNIPSIDEKTHNESPNIDTDNANINKDYNSNHNMKHKPVPLTILTGWLGSG